MAPFNGGIPESGCTWSDQETDCTVIVCEEVIREVRVFRPVWTLGGIDDIELLDLLCPAVDEQQPGEQGGEDHPDLLHPTKTTLEIDKHSITIFVDKSPAL